MKEEWWRDRRNDESCPEIVFGKKIVCIQLINRAYNYKKIRKC
jgi:hypothetical protein